MILLSFLGTGRYERAAYTWTDPSGETHTWASCYAAVAVTHFLRPERLVVLATPEAQDAHLATLRAELDDSMEVHVVDIPHGRTGEELWAIFAAIADQVPQGGEAALDVTHGFRSLPMVAILAAGYLRAARAARVLHVLYGSWDAREPAEIPGDPPRTPVLELTPMFALSEWAVAADRFVRSGDSRDLASLLREASPSQTGSSDPHGRRRALLAKALRETSLALALTQPLRAMRSAHMLSVRLREMEGRYGPQAAPFVEILEQVRETYTPLALPEPRDVQECVRNLAIQRHLVRWYLDRELYVQAASLAREWVISWLMLQRGETDLTGHDERASAENDLGQLVDAHKRGRARATLSEAPSGLDMGTFWNQLTDVRNAMAHGGMSRNDPKPETLVERLRALVKTLETLPLPEGGP